MLTMKLVFVVHHFNLLLVSIKFLNDVIHELILVTPDRFTNRMNIRNIGVTINGTRGVDDAKTLADCKFEVGDYIDVAIIPPRAPARDYPPRRSIDGPPRRFDRGDRFDRDRRRY